jgi:type IV secretory pathway TrbD component
VAVNGGDGMMVGARRTIVVMTGVAAATAATAGTVTDGGLTATGQ